MSNLIDFQWPVDEAGYVIKSEEIPEPNYLEIAAGKAPPPALSPGSHKCIAGRGGTVRTQRVCDTSEALFAELARTPKTQKGVLKFADKYGLLRSAPSLSNGNGGGSIEPLNHWYEAIDIVGHMLSVGNFSKALNPSPWHMSSVDIEIAAPRHGDTNPTLVMRPENLFGAIMLQLAFHLHAPIGDLLTCHQCGTIFPAGSGTRKRTTAKYCTQQCADRANYQRRKTQKVGS